MTEEFIPIICEGEYTEIVTVSTVFTGKILKEKEKYLLLEVRKDEFNREVYVIYKKYIVAVKVKEYSTVNNWEEFPPH